MSDRISTNFCSSNANTTKKNGQNLTFKWKKYTCASVYHTARVVNSQFFQSFEECTKIDREGEFIDVITGNNELVVLSHSVLKSCAV